jgi:PAS domain S-box-containing protein
VYRELVAHLPDYIVVLDRQRRFVWCNHYAPGLSAEQVIGRSFDELASADAIDAASVAIEHVFATGQPSEYESGARIEGLDHRTWRARVVPAASENGEPRVIVICQDITDQKRAEQERRESDARFRELVDLSPDYMIVLDAERRVIYSNRFRPDADPAAVLGRSIEDMAPPELKDEIRAKLERLFATGDEVTWSAASTVDSGRYAIRASRLPGAPPRALVVATDHSPPRQLADLLRVTEERLARALQAGDIGLWDLDVASGEGTMSAWFEEKVGRGGAITIDAWRAMIHPDDLGDSVEAMRACIEGRAPTYDQEYRVRHLGTGAWKRLIARGRTTLGPDGRKVMVGSMIDVTELRASEERRQELQRQLEHAQRLESIGMLAGGVAHDFNNLLSVISAGVDVARLAIRQGRSPEEDLGHIAAATIRAAELTRRLLAFGRRSPLRAGPVDVVALAHAVAEMARRVIPATIEIVVTAPDETLVTHGDFGQLEQVVLNLCLNARDAMPTGGRLELSARGCGDDVLVEVRDTGCGIPDGQRERIFEPFFTTKPIGSGSGLGLSMAHGLVQQHRGSITVESAIGRGATFTIRLPRHEAPRAERRVTEPLRAIAASGTVLVAEDEPLVRRMLMRLLESAGYRVLEAADGVEAVNVFGAHADEIDLAILDVVMPRLDGWGAYQRIRARRPDVAVLFCSGYAEGIVPTEIAQDACRFIGKPFEADALLGAAQSAIELSRETRRAAQPVVERARPGTR